MQQFGPGFAATFLYYFGSTALVFTLVAANALHVPIASGFPQQMGLVGGLLAGLIGGYFNRTISFSVPIDKKKKVLKEVEATLSAMGYQKKAEEDGISVYERSGIRKFLSGRVFVQIEGETMAIASRAVQIKPLKKQMMPS